MIRGLYTAATGMQSQQSRMDVVTNNLANAQTIGYKQDTLLTRSFEDVLISRMDDPAVIRSETCGQIGGGIHVDEIHTSFAAGTLKQTGLKTDLAIEGDGFFTIATPEGERYTRSGNFSVSGDGFLVTQDGYAVLGENGPIQVGSEDFSVGENGMVVHAAGINALKITSFENNNGLRKTGSNLFENYDAQMTDADSCQIHQGRLEQGNVDLTAQVVDMMTITRNYELNQRVLKSMDERLGQAVSEIGKI